MIKIKVPATSANLSVGFDCMGMAVNQYAYFTFQNNSKWLTINGCPKKFQNENNLVYKAFIKGCRVLKQPVPNVKITIQTEVPVSRGLGSSATCIVGGLKGAFEWFHHPISKQKLTQLAATMEGHPDNVAPAIYGGVCMAFNNQNDQVHVVKYPVNSIWKFLAIVPDFKISTQEARTVLPEQLSYQDATFQISHCLLMTHAIQGKRFSTLKEAMQDQMHEPFRKHLIKGYDQVKTITDQMHGILYISGSGSTLMLITNNVNDRQKIAKTIQNQFKKWQVKPISIDSNGIQSEVDINE
ncbi:homoserine kinase [Philodulcilactobacillus myokoensis]|uniref:Homoserine kinase n=1 Tax=Philodulcilactobacillus myokoensis TaxID=2929573 RepID=A0A9W6B2M5_9LACO|nr:homoserine kinase [Philodulcilactobacillus myokoensis]GLB47478.1 homoserine kinase [Philodulcilactobacillus myokoensis]